MEWVVVVVVVVIVVDMNRFLNRLLVTVETSVGFGEICGPTE